ncbi:MAG: hypothetical protein ACXVPN_11965 [Bacteroidia bacterium]
MLALVHYKGEKEVKRRIYSTFREVENNICDEFMDCDHYKVYDAESMDVIEEGEIEATQFADTLNMMYPNNESRDGF